MTDKRPSSSSLRPLRGRKCEECGHALTSHNSLSYCRYCSCGDWRAAKKKGSRLCDGCGVSLVWVGTEWQHAEPTRCDNFETVEKGS